MKSSVKEDWGNIFLNPAASGSTGKILFADVHAAQQTEDSTYQRAKRES